VDTVSDSGAVMTAAILHGREDVRIEQIPIPSPGPGEVLVKIKTALTCGTDLKVYRRGYHARMLKPPTVFGHEFSGVVDKVGDGVTQFSPGMRVVAANSAPCGKCFFCKKDKPNLCTDLLFVNGAYAEYICLPSRIVEKNLIEIPENVTFMQAALVEPLACVVKGVEDSDIHPGDLVGVLGTGPIAYMFVALAKLKGAKVISVGRRDERLSISQKLGADYLVNSTRLDVVEAIKTISEGNYGADVMIECIGQPVWWEKAIACLRKGGVVNLFGGCPSNTAIEVNTERLHYSELTLKASFHHTPKHIRESLELIATGRINTDLFISGEKPLNELPFLFDEMANRLNQSIKMAIIP